MMNPWNPLQLSGNPVDQPGQTDWNELVQAQQRWWTELVEAGQIWMSWWYCTLPPMPWPPTGTVLPAPQVSTDLAAGHAAPHHSSAAVTPPAPGAAQRKPRAQNVRHH